MVLRSTTMLSSCLFQRRQHVQPPMLSPQHRTARRKQMEETSATPHGEQDRLIPAPVYEREKSSCSSFDIERDKGTTVVYLEDEIDKTCGIDTVEGADQTDEPSPQSPVTTPKKQLTGNGVCGKHEQNGTATALSSSPKKHEPILIAIGAGSESDVQGCAMGIQGSPKKFYSQPPSYRSIGMDVSEPSENPSYMEDEQNKITSPECKQRECSGCGVLVDVPRVPSHLTNGPVTTIEEPPKQREEEPCTSDQQWNAKGNSTIGPPELTDATTPEENNQNNNNCSNMEQKNSPERREVNFFLDNDDRGNPPPAHPTQIPPKGLLMVKPRKTASADSEHIVSRQQFRPSNPIPSDVTKHASDTLSHTTYIPSQNTPKRNNTDPFNRSSCHANRHQTTSSSRQVANQLSPTHVQTSPAIVGDDSRLLSERNVPSNVDSPRRDARPKTLKQIPKQHVSNVTQPIPTDSIPETRRFSNPLVVYLSQFQDPSFSKISIYDNVRYVCDKEKPTLPGSQTQKRKPTQPTTVALTSKSQENQPKLVLSPSTTKSQVREFNI